MTEYQKIKEELKDRTSTTKYFTKKFLENFKDAFRKNSENVKNDVDDSYPYEHYHRHHCYDRIYEDKFYIENGCAYCSFLELVHAKYKDKWLTA